MEAVVSIWLTGFYSGLLRNQTSTITIAYRINLDQNQHQINEEEVAGVNATISTPIVITDCVC
jgi:hypothetical protein